MRIFLLLSFYLIPYSLFATPCNSQTITAKRSYQIEEQNQEGGETCSACNTHPKRYRFSLPKAYHSYRYFPRFYCHGDLYEEWIDAEPSWPSKREDSWMDELGR